MRVAAQRPPVFPLRRNTPVLSPKLFAIFLTPALLCSSAFAQTSQPPAPTTEKPDATLDYSGGTVAAGIGYSWGHGVLHFEGKDYPFTVNGLNAVNVGASSVTASGKVYHLKKAEDFPGTYFTMTVGVTLAGGAAGVMMENKQGVVIEATSTNQGLQLSLAPSGITLAFDGPPK
jgi:hypothetical protein